MAAKDVRRRGGPGRRPSPRCRRRRRRTRLERAAPLGTGPGRGNRPGRARRTRKPSGAGAAPPAGRPTDGRSGGGCERRGYSGVVPALLRGHGQRQIVVTKERVQLSEMADRAEFKRAVHGTGGISAVFQCHFQCRGLDGGPIPYGWTEAR